MNEREGVVALARAILPKVGALRGGGEHTVHRAEAWLDELSPRASVGLRALATVVDRASIFVGSRSVIARSIGAATLCAPPGMNTHTDDTNLQIKRMAKCN